jgi:hypothetical protein
MMMMMMSRRLCDLLVRQNYFEIVPILGLVMHNFLIESSILGLHSKGGDSTFLRLFCSAGSGSFRMKTELIFRMKLFVPK